MTNPTQPTGTIDITDFAESLRQSFVTWGTAYIFGLEAAIPGMEWIALPIIDVIDKEMITAVLNLLSKSVVMEAFFINTSLRKASQAQDYTDAVAAKINLPATATTEEYARAEKLEMLAFRNFVLLSN